MGDKHKEIWINKCKTSDASKQDTGVKQFNENLNHVIALTRS